MVQHILRVPEFQLVWKVQQVKDVSKQTEGGKGPESSESPTSDEDRRSRGPLKGPDPLILEKAQIFKKVKMV